MGPLGLPSDSQAAESTNGAFQDAIALFEAHADYPSVQIEIHEAMAKMPRSRPLENAERLRSASECFDIYAHAFLRLVSDMPSQNAFIALLNEWADFTWFNYAGYGIEGVLQSGHPDVEMILERARHWKNEGYKRLAAAGSATAPRRGYRSHVRAWMEKTELKTVSQAAKRLGVSESTLKSIMS